MPAVNRRYTFAKRRKAHGLTNYKKRLDMLKSGLLRVVVRRTANSITAQLVKYEQDGDKVLTSASTQELAKLGWTGKKNVPTSYLVGYLLAKKAQKNKLADTSVLDVGFFTPIAGVNFFCVSLGFRSRPTER